MENGRYEYNKNNYNVIEKVVVTYGGIDINNMYSTICFTDEDIQDIKHVFTKFISNLEKKYKLLISSYISTEETNDYIHRFVSEDISYFIDENIKSSIVGNVKKQNEKCICEYYYNIENVFKRLNESQDKFVVTCVRKTECVKG